MAHLEAVMSPSNLSESVRECALRLRESGTPALGGLYDLTATRLVRFATSITRNQQDAEDAVSTVLLKVLESPSILLHATAPWSYLLRMVHNESLLILRKRKRWSIVQGIMDLWTVVPVDEIDREEALQAVWRELRALPTEQSEVVVLKIWEEMTFQQISEILEVPAPTAASRYRYAMTKLASRLSFEFSEVRHVD
jgi:RNA polymerase sigma-70 factor (ECF subfamily)